MIRPLTPSEIERFWSKMDRSGGADSCWLWRAGKDKDGYGKFQIGPKGGQIHLRSHRLALHLHTGKWGEATLHSCDTPACCNPNHLSWGTQTGNRADCVLKDRHTKGEASNWRLNPPRGMKHPRCKLSDDDVRSIRARCTNTKQALALAEEFGVTARTIYKIAKHIYRKDVTP